MSISNGDGKRLNKDPRTRRRASIGERMVEEAWSGVLASIDSRAQRRGKTSMKQGDVGPVSVSNGRLVAQVRRRGPDRRPGKVSLPLIDDWTVYKKSVATWFCQRPDWLATLMAGQWDEEFLEFIAGNGLQLFPPPDSIDGWLSQAECDCGEWEQPCHHVAALIHRIVDEVARSPLNALSFVGLRVEDILDEAHALSVSHVLQKSRTRNHGDAELDLAHSVSPDFSMDVSSGDGRPAEGRLEESRWGDGRLAEASLREGHLPEGHLEEGASAKSALGPHSWLEERTVFAPSNQQADFEEKNRTTDPNDGWIKRNLLFPALDEGTLSDLTLRYLYRDRT